MIANHINWLDCIWLPSHGLPIVFAIERIIARLVAATAVLQHFQCIVTATLASLRIASTAATTATRFTPLLWHDCLVGPLTLQQLLFTSRRYLVMGQQSILDVEFIQNHAQLVRCFGGGLWHWHGVNATLVEVALVWWQAIKARIVQD